MSYTKTHDLCVKTGTYEKGGEEKGRYENVGMILNDGEDELFLIKRTFNPAGVPNPDGRDSVIVNAFKVKDKEAKRSTHTADEAPPPDDLDQDVPF